MPTEGEASPAPKPPGGTKSWEPQLVVEPAPLRLILEVLPREGGERQGAHPLSLPSDCKYQDCGLNAWDPPPTPTSDLGSASDSSNLNVQALILHSRSSNVGTWNPRAGLPGDTQIHRLNGACFSGVPILSHSSLKCFLIKTDIQANANFARTLQNEVRPQRKSNGYPHPPLLLGLPRWAGLRT